MAWGTEFPPTAEFNPFRYSTFIQFYKAATERKMVVFGGRFPRHISGYGSGTIYGIEVDPGNSSQYLLTLRGLDGNPTNYVYGTTPPFDDDDTRPPKNEFDIVIELDAQFPVFDERKIFRMEIVDVPDVDVFTVPRRVLDDAVTGNIIPNVGAIIDAPFEIVRENNSANRYPWWNDRIPAWPNTEGEDWISNISSFSFNTITDASAEWVDDQFVGKTVWYRSNGYLVKSQIIDNTSTTLTLSPGSSMPDGGEFRITPTGGAFFRMSTLDAMNRWYRGSVSPKPSYLPPNVYSVDHPDGFIPWYKFGSPLTVDAFDQDQFVEESTYDPLYDVHPSSYHAGPNMYKCYRGLQLGIRGLVSAFVPPVRSYDGEAHIPTYTLATWFHDARVGFHGVTPASVDSSGFARFTIPFPFPSAVPGVKVFYTIVQDNKVIQNYNEISYESASELIHQIPVEYANSSAVEVVYAYGEPRKLAREFMLMFDHTHFVGSSGGSSPTTSDPGQWITRNKSDRYREFSEEGDLFETEELKDGDRARYCGDNVMDAQITSNYSPATLDADHVYYKNGYVGMFEESIQTAVNAQLTGAAQIGSTDRMLVGPHNWWQHPGMPGTSAMPTHSGTGMGGGSTTRLVDTNISSNPYFYPGSGRGVGFILEVQIGAETQRRGIVAINIATGTIDVDPAHPFTLSTVGRNWAIREPTGWVLNRYRGREVTITRSDSTTFTAIIDYSDDYRLYADFGETIEPDWTFSIDDPPTGTVWRRVGTIGGRWEKIGNYDDMRGHVPTIVRRYGKLRKNDYMPLELFDALYNGLNYLVWTKATPGWRGRLDINIPEDNFFAGSSSGSAFPYNSDGGFFPDFTSAITAAVAEAEGLGVVLPDGGIPLQRNRTSDSDHFGPDPSGGFASALFLSIAGYCYIQFETFGINCETEFLNYGYIEQSNPDQGIVLNSPSTRTKYQFDDNGHPVLFRRWKSFFTVTSNTSDERITDKFHDIETGPWDLSFPAPDPVPPATTTAASSLRGFYIGDSAVINKWNIGGGFVYALPPEEGEDELGGDPADYYPPDEDGWSIEPEGATPVDAPVAGETSWFWYPI